MNTKRSILILLIFSFLCTAYIAKSVRSQTFSLSEQQIIYMFDDLIQEISISTDKNLNVGQQNSLVKKLENSKDAFNRGQPCTASNILEAFLNETQALRNENRIFLAENLHNDAWMLRYEMLKSLPESMKCKGYEKFGIKSATKIQESNNKRLKVSLAFAEPYLLNVVGEGEQFTQLFIPGIESFINGMQSFSGVPGFPAVPIFQRLVAFPRGSNISISVSAPIISRIIHLNLFPYQIDGPAIEASEEPYYTPPFIKNNDVYAADGPFPSNVCTIKPIGQYRDVNIALLSCSAGQYFPKKNILNLFSSIDFEIIFEGGSGAFVTETTFNPFEYKSKELLSYFLNNEMIPLFVELRFPEPTCQGEELIIFTPELFKDPAERLASWKREKGIITNVVQVGSSTTEEEIDAYIEDRYERCTVRPSYVLLFGDAEHIPTFYTQTLLSPAAATDYPYALNNQQIIGMISDIFIPDFAVGRIPVDTVVQANDMVDKIINYEKNPNRSNPNYYKNVSLVSNFECCRLRQDIQNWQLIVNTLLDNREHKNFIRSSEFVRVPLLNLGYNVNRIYTEKWEDGQTSWFAYRQQIPPPNSDIPIYYWDGTSLPVDIGSNSGFGWDGWLQDVIDAFNDGNFLISYRGHASWTGWANPRFKISDFSFPWSNSDKLPVVYSLSCSSAFFDNETNPTGNRPSNPNKPYPTGPDVKEEVYFAEQLLRTFRSHGAIAFIGSTRDSTAAANDALGRGLFDATWPNTLPDFGTTVSIRRLGDVLNYAKMYVLSQINVPQDYKDLDFEPAFNELYLYNLLGDPTLEMWISEPLFLLTDRAKIEIQLDSIRVTYPIEGTTITAFQINTNGLAIPIGRATVENGQALLFYQAQPDLNLPLHFSASRDNDVSRSLTPLPLSLIVDQLNDAPTGRSFGCGNNHVGSLYQSFKPSTSPLVAVKLGLRTGGSFPPSGFSTTIRVRKENVQGEILSEATTFLDSPQRDVIYVLPFPISVDLEDTYIIEWISEGDNILTWLGIDDAYVRGEAYGCSGSLLDFEGVYQDMIFTTYTRQ